MKAKEYCRNLDMELSAWKGKLYDVIRKMDQLPTGDKEKMYENVNGLHMLMSELEERIDTLRTQCPTDWQAEEGEIKVKMDDLEKRYKDTANILFDYDFGG